MDIRIYRHLYEVHRHHRRMLAALRRLFRLHPHLSRADYVRVETRLRETQAAIGTDLLFYLFHSELRNYEELHEQCVQLERSSSTIQDTNSDRILMQWIEGEIHKIQ